MIIIDSPSTNAYFNMALEEFLLCKYPTASIFLLYINSPSIIIGKFQNTLAEINIDYIKENKINVVRRMSGGGAVYHDLGNLNFSFHTLLDEHDFMDFSRFTKPVLNVLNRLNIAAKLEGRNDLLVDGKKFSGNAKLSKNGKMIQHGTILFDSNMEILDVALKINPLKYKDKAVKSNRSRVVNLKEYLPDFVNIEHLKQNLIAEMLTNSVNAEIKILTELDILEVEKLVEKKYNTWDWNYGFSPKYSFTNAAKIPAGFIEAHIDIAKGGTIEKMKIFGDFFATKPIEEFEKLFIGSNHDSIELENLLNKINLTDYFGKVTKEEILEILK